MYTENLKRVYYKDFEQNAFNPTWSGWRTLIEIEKKLKPSKYYNDPISHMYLFLNNYWLEEAVRKELNLSYRNTDHIAIYDYCGLNIPDFIDEKGITYELKQGKDLNSLRLIAERDWHNCQIKLFYSRMDKRLYSSVNGFTWRELCSLDVKHINPDKGLKLKDIVL